MIDDRERMLLVEASHDARPVVVQGVTIVLSNALIDRGTWQPATRLGLSHPVLGGPRLAFPWTPPEHLKWLGRNGDYVSVEGGDIVCIERVRVGRVETAFGEDDHPHNREGRLARLVVLRKGGIDEIIPTFLAFHGVQATIRPGVGGEPNEQISSALFHRLEKSCGFEVRDFVDLEPAAWPPFPDRLTIAEREAILCLLDHGGEATVGFGYWMGRAEAEAGLGLSAAHHRARRAKHTVQGRKRGAAIIEEAENRWGSEGFRIALRHREQDPSLGQKALAEAIFASPHLPDGAPGYDAILAAVRRWESTGRLPRSTGYRGSNPKG